MLNELEDKINKVKTTIESHFARLNFAYNQLLKLLPFTSEKISNLDDPTISYIDQYIFRFSKLQDIIGEQLFRIVLIQLNEEIENKSFRDILNKLENLEIIPEREIWLKLRQARNELSHDYPQELIDTADALNYIFNQKETLETIYNNCIEVIK